MSFDIVNPTKFRISLHSVNVSILGDGSWGMRRPDTRPDFLPSHGRYSATINVPLKDAKRGHFGGTKFSLTIEIINVSVEYEGILREREVQKFAMSCTLISELKTGFIPLPTKEK